MMFVLTDYTIIRLVELKSVFIDTNVSKKVVCTRSSLKTCFVLTSSQGESVQTSYICQILSIRANATHDIVPVNRFQ